MKKFLLSICMLAVASVCLFMTSCKDDDEPAVVQVTGSLDQVIGDETSTNPGFVYSFELDGRTYNSLDALKAAIAALPEGTTHTLTVIGTDANGKAHRGNTTTFTSPRAGQSVTIPIDVPLHDADHSQGATLVITAPESHNGGAVE